MDESQKVADARAKLKAKFGDKTKVGGKGKARRTKAFNNKNK